MRSWAQRPQVQTGQLHAQQLCSMLVPASLCLHRCEGLPSCRSWGARQPHHTTWPHRLRPQTLHKAAAAAQQQGDSNSSGDGTGSEPQEDWRPFQLTLFHRMMGFMGPALLIPLGDPLMGLVDSITIGQFAGTMELAALGPANMVFSFAIYIFQSLQVATLSLVGTHMRDGQLSHAATTLGTGLRLALVAGLLSTAILAGLHTQIIQATGVRDPSLIAPAAGYLKTRAIAQPAVLMSMVAQSGMLAQQNSLTPCLSVMLTVAASLVANLVFVAGLGWGLQGAAVTTVAAQYIGVFALLWALHRPSSTLKPDWSPADAREVWTFLRTMLPLTVVSMSKNTCYLIVQTSAATLNTLKLAAHQATFSLWALGTWTFGPIEQACLAYLPTARTRWQQLASVLLVLPMGAALSLMVGLLMGGVLGCAPGILVKDAAVQPLMSSIAPQAMLSMAVVGLDVCANAINLSLKDFAWVARSMVITLATISGYFLVGRRQGWMDLGGVWWGLLLFFAVRAVQSFGRALWLLGVWPGRGAATSDLAPNALQDQLQQQQQAAPAASIVAQPTPLQQGQQQTAGVVAANGYQRGDGSWQPAAAEQPTAAVPQASQPGAEQGGGGDGLRGGHENGHQQQDASAAAQPQVQDLPAPVVASFSQAAGRQASESHMS